MEYLFDVRWSDPVAKALAGVLSKLPDGVEQTTVSVPLEISHGFTVLRADDATALKQIANAMTAAGADVHIVAREAA
jgi:hypothetical protein